MVREKFDRMGRRRFTKSAAAFGVSIPSLFYGSQDELADLMTGNEVPYVSALETVNEPESGAPEREPVYDTIERDEWVRRWTAVGARNKIAKRVQRLDDTGLVTPGFVTMDSSPTGFGVEIDYKTVHAGDQTRSPSISKAELRDKLPETVTGTAAKDDHKASREVPVRIVSVETHEVGNGCGDGDQCTTGNDWSQVPGGADIYYTGNGTVCSAFYHDSYGYGSTTAAHIMDSEGDSIYEGETDTELGITRDRRYDGVDIDFAFYDYSASSDSEADKISNSDATDFEYEVSGAVTNDALINDTDSVTYYTQGMSTCRLSGTVDGVKGIGNTYFVSDHDVDAGDSGGPLFKLDSNGDAKIAGLVAKELNKNYESDEDSDSCGDDCKGNTAETIENKLGGFFY